MPFLKPPLWYSLHAHTCPPHTFALLHYMPVSSAPITHLTSPPPPPPTPLFQHLWLGERRKEGGRQLYTYATCMPVPCTMAVNFSGDKHDNALRTFCAALTAHCTHLRTGALRVNIPQRAPTCLPPLPHLPFTYHTFHHTASYYLDLTTTTMRLASCAVSPSVRRALNLVVGTWVGAW